MGLRINFLISIGIGIITGFYWSINYGANGIDSTIGTLLVAIFIFQLLFYNDYEKNKRKQIEWGKQPQ